MGLDVYLYKYENFERSEAIQTEYREFSDQIWEAEGDYNEISAEKKKEITEICKAKARELGLDEWGDDINGKQRIELTSNIHPDHLFKIGYMRSSYNDGGVNSVLGKIIGKDLYYAFHQEDSNDYVLKPDWAEARCRMMEMEADFDEAIRKLDGRYMHISARQGFSQIFSINNIVDLIIDTGNFGNLLPGKYLTAETKEDALAIFINKYNEEKMPNERRRPGGQELNYGPFEAIEIDMDFSLEGLPVQMEEDVVKHIQTDHPSILRFDNPIRVRAVIDGIEILNPEEILKRAIKLKDIREHYQPDKEEILSGLNPLERMKWIQKQPKKSDEQLAKEMDCLTGIRDFYKKKAFVIVDKSEERPAIYVGPDAWNSGWYSASDGEYMMGDPPVCHAIFKGGDNFIRQNSQALYLIYESIQENEEDSEPYAWYKDAIEVATEMCEWVLEQEDQDKFYLHWSG